MEMELLEMELFEDKVKNLKINSVVERNNFKFVRDFYEENIKFDDYGYSCVGLTDDFIKKNIKEIDDAIFNNIVNTKKSVLIELKESFNNLKQNYQEFIDYSNKTSKSEKRLLNDVKVKLYYNIVELRVSLGLSLMEFDDDCIYDYAEAIKFDINNGKYKRLDIQSHVIDGNLENRKAY